MVAFLSQFLRAGALGSIKTSYAQPKKTDHLKVVGFLSFGWGIFVLFIGFHLGALLGALPFFFF